MPKKNGKPTAAELRHQKMQEKINNVDYLVENAPILNWTEISSKYYLSDEALNKCSKYIRWSHVSRSRELSEDILIKYYKKIQPRNIFCHQNKITSALINIMAPSLHQYDWDLLCERFKLPIDIIEKYYVYLNLGKLIDDHLTDEEKQKLDAIKMLQTLSK